MQKLKNSLKNMINSGKTMNCQVCENAKIVRHEYSATFFKNFKWCGKYDRCLGPADISVMPCDDCISANSHE